MTDREQSTPIKAPTGVILWLRAETFVHVGSGQQSSLIDLPFARESSTGYPYIPGSGMKGALRDSLRLCLQSDDQTNAYFGAPDNAGPILVGDARLVFLPVRSLSQPYYLVTCKALMARLVRDMQFATRKSITATVGASLKEEEFATTAYPPEDDTRFLEQFPFKPSKTKFALTGEEIPAPVKSDVDALATVLHDKDFDYFARHGLHVRMRNRLVPETKIVATGALWSEESLPPDTLLSLVLMPRTRTSITQLREVLDLFKNHLGGYVQVGGNETVGEGWFSILNLDTALQSLPETANAA